MIWNIPKAQLSNILIVRSQRDIKKPLRHLSLLTSKKVEIRMWLVGGKCRDIFRIRVFEIIAEPFRLCQRTVGTIRWAAQPKYFALGLRVHSWARWYRLVSLNLGKNFERYYPSSIVTTAYNKNVYFAQNIIFAFFVRKI